VNGTPVPYLSCAIIAMAVASYLSAPMPSGCSAVNTCPQALQRNRSISYTVASTGACPITRTNLFGCRCE